MEQHFLSGEDTAAFANARRLWIAGEIAKLRQHRAQMAHDAGLAGAGGREEALCGGQHGLAAAGCDLLKLEDQRINQNFERIDPRRSVLQRLAGRIIHVFAPRRLPADLTGPRDSTEAETGTPVAQEQYRRVLPVFWRLPCQWWSCAIQSPPPGEAYFWLPTKATETHEVFVRGDGTGRIDIPKPKKEIV